MSKIVATIVIVNQDKILVLKRGPNQSNPNLWNFPGGSVEKDETLEEGAIRELKEEANLEVNSDYVEYIGTINRDSLEVNCYITREYSGEVKINKESSEFKWVTLEELKKLAFVGGGKINPKLWEKIKDFMDRKG